MSKRFLFLLGFLAFSNLVIAGTESVGVRVIPSRYTLVQFGLDMVSLRPVRLVAYDVKTGGETAKIFLWNTATRAWDRIDADRYLGGFGAGKAPVVVVRDQAGLPKVLETAPAWSSEMKQLDAPDLAGLANMMNDRLQFTAQEWGWLAPRYGIKTRDLNEERRRYGRYGKPGQGPLRPVPPAPAELAVPLPEAKGASGETAAVPDAAKKAEPEAARPEEAAAERFEKGDAAEPPDINPPDTDAGEAKAPAAAEEHEISLENVPAVETKPRAEQPPPSGQKEPKSAADSDAAKAAAVLDAGRTKAKPEVKTPDAPLAMDK